MVKIPLEVPGCSMIDSHKKNRENKNLGNQYADYSLPFACCSFVEVSPDAAFDAEGVVPGDVFGLVDRAAYDGYPYSKN